MPKRQIPVTRIFDRNARATAPIIINVGGARSGKSYSILQLLLQKFLSEDKKEILIARKTLPSLRITAYKVFVSLLHDYGFYQKCTHNKTNLTIKYRNNTVYFLSIDDPEKIKSTEFNYVFLEEANEFAYNDFMILWTRMSAPTVESQPNRMYLALNPSDEFSWVHQKVSNWDNIKIIHSTYLDNPFLDTNYRKILEDLKDTDPELYQIYALGEYATLSNIIYKNYEIIPTAIDPLSKSYDTYYGLDFGFNHPTAMVRISSRDAETYVKEVIYQTHLTNQDLINLITDLGVNKTSPIYADAAEPARIEEIYRAGYNIHPAEKKVTDGIDSVKRCRLHVHKDSTSLIKEIRTYKWKKDKNDNILDDPVKFKDDCMDAMRYAIHTHGTAPDPGRFTVVSSSRDW